MKIPTITEMRFPRTDEGRKMAYSYIVGMAKQYPEINSEIIEEVDHYVLLLTYVVEYGR